MEYCSFCNKSKLEVKSLISNSSNDIFICNECVDEASKLFKEDPSESSVNNLENKILTPRQIVDYLNQYIIGQEETKKSIAVAVYNHYKRLNNPTMNGVEINKSNILLVGPTGSGKTLIGQTVAKLLDVPFIIADATTLTQAGYVGDDVESILQRLINAADGDVKKAERGIIFIDEIDKIAKRDSGTSITRDVSGEGVQQSLLKIIEGTLSRIPKEGTRKHPNSQVDYIDTKNILFICGGAFVELDKIINNRNNKKQPIGFSKIEIKNNELEEKLKNKILAEDLVHFGFIPEFIGRLPIICKLNALSKNDLKNILIEPKNSVLKQFIEIFKSEDVSLNITDNAINQIIDLSIQNNTGARGLRSILEEILREHMFYLPEKDKEIKNLIIENIYQN